MVGEELLQLAPAQAPPAGFEAAVVARLTEPPRRWPVRPLGGRWPRVAAAAAAVVLAATLGAGSVVLATAGDRRLAEGYQAVLRQGQGAYFVAAPLQGARGRVGTVFGYQGRPSWVMVTLAPSIPAPGRVQVQVLTRDGRSLSLGQAVLGGAAGSWGAQLPVDLSAVQELRLLGSDGRPTLTATFTTTNPRD